MWQAKMRKAVAAIHNRPIPGTLTLGMAVLLGGCATLQTQPEPAAQQVAAQPQPPPAVYRDEVVLFGSMRPALDVNPESFPATPQIQHTWIGEGADFDPNVDPTGERIVFASTRHSLRPDIYVKAVDGATVTQLTADPAADINPVFSPDGTQIAFASDRSGNWDIWLLNLEDQRVSQLTHSPATEVYPTWAPDGKRLAYCCQNAKSGEWELWVICLERESPAKFVGYGMYPRWSPVNDTLLFQRPRRRGEPLFSVWMMQLIDGEPSYATELIANETAGMILPSWSRDGTHVAYCTVPLGGGVLADDGRPRSGDSEIWVVDREGRGRVRITDGVGASYSPTWSADGRIYYSCDRGGKEHLWSALPSLPELNVPTRVTRAAGGSGHVAGGS